jgi:hypothetical protein
MPLFLIVVGLVLLVASIRGTQKELFDTLKSDFTGSNNFVFWVLALGIISALGTIKTIRPVTQGFLALVILVIFLVNRGLIPSFIDQVKRGTSGK